MAQVGTIGQERASNSASRSGEVINTRTLQSRAM
jgi:hypothetical protein